MAKSPDAFRTISEVAEWLELPAHVLRFWESRFAQVKPVKRAGGRRYYRPADMELLGGIKRLLHDDGMTIRGVQKILREDGVRHVASMSQPVHLPVEHRSHPPRTRPDDSAGTCGAGDGAEDDPAPSANSGGSTEDAHVGQRDEHGRVLSSPDRREKNEPGAGAPADQTSDEGGTAGHTARTAGGVASGRANGRAVQASPPVNEDEAEHVDFQRCDDTVDDGASIDAPEGTNPVLAPLHVRLRAGDRPIDADAALSRARALLRVMDDRA